MVRQVPAQKPGSGLQRASVAACRVLPSLVLGSLWAVGGFGTALATAVLLPGARPALAQAAAKPRQVTVKEGDTLEVIAGRHGVSVEALQRLNSISDPRTLQIGQVLKLPPANAAKPAPATKPAATKPAAAKPAAAKPAAAKPAAKPAAKAPASPTPATPTPATTPAQTKPAEPSAAGTAPEADPVEKPQQGRWRYFGNTLVDWGSWKLHPGGLRVTVVQPAAEDVGASRARATAVAVQCSSLRQTWRVDGAWLAWAVPEPRSVGQQIVLDLCDEVQAPQEGAIPPPAPAPGV